MSRHGSRLIMGGSPQWLAVAGPQCVMSAKVQDLTGRMDQRGRLTWDVPAGRWLILRIGHTVAGGTTRMAQAEAAELECDKLSKSALESHLSAMVDQLVADVGPLAGKSLVSIHIDSWESGSGNWTAGFREEFRRRRGYDLLPYLPTLNGLVVDSLEVSERFLWDYESVFVVFRPEHAAFDPAISLTLEGRNIPSPPPVPVKLVVKKASYGVAGDAAKTRDVTAKVQAIVQGGERRFAACRLGEGDDPAMQKLKLLSIDYTLDGTSRKTVVSDGETACLDETIDPMPTARLQRTADGHFLLEAWQNGQYELQTASSRTLRFRAEGIPDVQPIAGPWDVQFPAGGGAPERIKLDRLISWSRHGDLGVKYFSGTAKYRTTFRVPPAALAAGRAFYLDLGQVAVLAELKLNGKDLGILWKVPFRLDATPALRSGENLLEVRVTNLWVNRMIGDEQLAEDSERNPDGLLKAWPNWLLEGKSSPAGRHTFATYCVWKKDSPLQESGLLGPVHLYGTQRVALE